MQSWVETPKRRKANKTMARCLATSFDKNYMKYACVMLQSFADSYKKQIDVVCMVPSEMANSKCEAEIASAIDAPHLSIKCRSSERYEELIQSRDWERVANPHASNAALLKVFVSSICREYDSVAYIDPDCLIRKDPTNFIEHELYGKKIVAYAEHGFGADRDLKMPERAYFNNGVFVTDLNYWRDAKVEDQIVTWMLENETGPLIEQTAMNFVLYEEWFPMSPNFNCRDSRLSEHSLYYLDPTIVHFLGPIKPWIADPNVDSKRGPWDIHWRRMYNKIWGMENFSRAPYKVPPKK